MTIAAKISSSELTAQVTNRFADTFFEVRLIDATGTTYIPGTTDDATFLGFEFTAGSGGYQRSIINWTASDVLAYSDDGVALTRKAAVFAQNGTATTINFSHVVLVWSDGNVTGFGANTAAPASGVDGIYTSVPVDNVSSSGSGLTVDIAVANSGAATTDYVLTVNKPGYGYAAADTLTIGNAELQSIGLTAEVTGSIDFTVGGVSNQSEAGNILSVAQTASPVVVSGGNEVAFYFNLKQFGFNA